MPRSFKFKKICTLIYVQFLQFWSVLFGTIRFRLDMTFFMKSIGLKVRLTELCTLWVQSAMFPRLFISCTVCFRGQSRKKKSAVGQEARIISRGRHMRSNMYHQTVTSLSPNFCRETSWLVHMAVLSRALIVAAVLPVLAICSSSRGKIKPIAIWKLLLE